MKIVFITSTCSQKKYTELFYARKEKIIDPAQKFFDQIIRGVANSEHEVISIGALPVSASTIKKKLFRKEIEEVGKVKYIYPGFVNGKILRFITVFFSVLIEAAKINAQETVFICDPLYTHVSLPARTIAKIKGIKTIAMVTDIPSFATSMKYSKHKTVKERLQSVYEYFSELDIKKYDGYINLSVYMNELINPKNKPSITIEGSIDEETVNSGNKKEIESPDIVLYAGGVFEQYGVKTLVNAFSEIEDCNAELHIYGSGSYVHELERVCKKHYNIKYCGCVLNSDLLNIEKKALLLVNPRPTREVFTKYSFPSKTLEYMMSGTPLLSTRLLGIPKDYYEFVYWIDDESKEGIKNILKSILKKSKEELYLFGNQAKEFAVINKSNIVQGRRIVEFLMRFV